MDYRKPGKALEYDEQKIVVGKDKVESELELEGRVSPPEDFREIMAMLLSRNGGFANAPEAMEYHRSAIGIYGSCVGSNGCYWIDPFKLFKKVDTCRAGISQENPATARDYFAAVPSILDSMHGKDEECVYLVIEKFGDYAKSLGGSFLRFSVETDFCSYKIPNPLQMIDYRAEVYQMPKTHPGVQT